MNCTCMPSMFRARASNRYAQAWPSNVKGKDAHVWREEQHQGAGLGHFQPLTMLLRGGLETVGTLHAGNNAERSRWWEGIGTRHLPYGNRQNKGWVKGETRLGT
jgi:hypothetical protein